MAGEIIVDFHDRKVGLDAAGNFVLATGGQFVTSGRASQVTAVVTPGTLGSNQTNVALTVADDSGTAIAAPRNFDLWLSDAANGAGLTATTASGAVAAGANGADFGDYTTKKAKRVQSNVAGLYTLSITDAAKTAFRVCVDLGGGTMVVATLSPASYG